MSKYNVYEWWVLKYGKNEADEKQKNMIKKRLETNQLKKELKEIEK